MYNERRFQIILLLSTCLASVPAFIGPANGALGRRSHTRWSTVDDDLASSTSFQEQKEDEEEVIRAPLKYIGPYPAIGLRFPKLATTAQRAKGIAGIGLDFVLDTAANVNTINGQVAEELQLEVVGEALPGVGSSGTISGGSTYNLGDTELEGILPTSTGKSDDDDKIEPFLFMQNLTASALPVASPASAGLMSLAFFYCFEGGVEFSWGTTSTSKRPSISFYAEKGGEKVNSAVNGLCKVKIEPVPVTRLPSITLEINGIKVPALLDTGSPITVLNSQAAELAGIDTAITLPKQKEPSKNPFSAISSRFQEAQLMAKAATEGNVLMMAGPTGPINLLKSREDVEIMAVGVEKEKVSFGRTRIYVGDIPGLIALKGIGVDAPPAVVLGMDVLTKRPKMFLRVRDDEVYF